MGRLHPFQPAWLMRWCIVTLVLSTKVVQKRKDCKAVSLRNIVTQDVPDVPDVLVLRTSSGQKNILSGRSRTRTSSRYWGSILYGEGCRSCTVLAIAVTVTTP